MKEKPIIAILIGDASGIGPEIVAKLLTKKFFEETSRPVLIGDHRVLKKALELINEDAAYCVFDSIDSASWEKGIPFINVGKQDPAAIETGMVSEVCGAACIEMIRYATQMYQVHKIDGVCYAPLNKAAMKAAHSPAPSEIELFAQLLGQKSGFGEINMLDGVWTTRVTSHIPVKQISEKLSVDNILDSIRLAYVTLQTAGFQKPKIGVCALNPHGGENGLCGDEEMVLISPAVEKAKELGIDAKGPYPADTLFNRAFSGEFDAAVTMFHDQGQIALKVKGFDRGITIGGGLEIPITTCAHGTAHDIAGKGIAATTSLENAFKMVSIMAANVNNTMKG